jgi:AraC-like DNA-binding protein
VGNTNWQVYKSVVIRENTIHQFDSNKSVQLLLYLDAETEIAKSIKSKYLNGIDASSLEINILENVSPGELEKCLTNPNSQMLEQLVLRLLNAITESKLPSLPDERIEKVIKLLATDNYEKITIAFLAKKIYLSESRLRFLFKSRTGVPLHRYIIWNKITLALKKIMNGDTVEDAAVSCGFTDTSHFHKLLVQMFGVTPSQFIVNNSRRQLKLFTPTKMNIQTRFYDEYSGKTEVIHCI